MINELSTSERGSQSTSETLSKQTQDLCSRNSQKEISKRIHERMVNGYYDKSKQKNKNKEKDNYKKCPICLYRISKKDMEFLTCCHFFHKKCMDIYFQNSILCPICRIPVFIQDSEQLQKFNSYLENQRNNSRLIRQNRPRNDFALSLMFIKDKKLFPMENVEEKAKAKLRCIMNINEPNPIIQQIELYYAEEIGESSNDSNIYQELSHQESIALRLYNEEQMLEGYRRRHAHREMRITRVIQTIREIQSNTEVALSNTEVALSNGDESIITSLVPNNSEIDEIDEIDEILPSIDMIRSSTRLIENIVEGFWTSDDEEIIL
jgi:RING finger family protein